MKGRPRGGFTLLEAVVVISLLSIVGLSFAYLLTTSQRFLIQSTDAAANQSDAAFALEHIKRHLMVATGITTPATGAGGNILEFTWQEIVAGVATDRTSKYQLNGSDLEYIADTTVGTAETIARGIQTITFDRAVAGTVAVDITAQRTSGADAQKMRLQTSISPRGIFQ